MLDSQCKVKICDFGLSRCNVTGQYENTSQDASTDETRKSRTKEIQNQKQTRDLTDHVTARWYRSPEVILKSRNYDSKIDIFALGCILGEMLRFCQKMERDNKKILFQGNSCFPMSPLYLGNDQQPVVDANDQLIKIFKLIGPQDE